MCITVRPASYIRIRNCDASCVFQSSHFPSLSIIFVAFETVCLSLPQSLVFALLCAAVGTLADHPHPAPSSYHEPSYPDVPPAYNFDWNVYNEYANNNYGHTETRNDKSTSGSYFVALPDGRTQKVTYSVDGYGGEISALWLRYCEREVD